MTKATVKIPKDLKHRIVLPKEIWEFEHLDYGDFIEIDVKKIEKPKVTEWLMPNWKNSKLVYGDNTLDHIAKHRVSLDEVYNVLHAHKWILRQALRKNS